MLHTDVLTPCTADPDLWFSRVGSNIRKAKALCRTCPVQLSCLENALETEEMLGHMLHGIHGALTPQERMKLRIKRHA